MMIGLIAAMPSEVEAVTAHMNDVKEKTIADVVFHEGTLVGQPMVIALSGVGKVAAAMAATLMCREYRPDILLNVGVAGGLKEDQQVGDLVISDKIVQADFDTTPIDGPKGLGKEFNADAMLVDKAVSAATSLNFPYKVGMVASQDIFLSREEDIEKLLKEFPQAACAEMEGGAVAQVAQAFKTPVLVIRSLSDVVHHAGNPMEFSEFEKDSANKAGLFMQTLAASL